MAWFACGVSRHHCRDLESGRAEAKVLLYALNHILPAADGLLPARTAVKTTRRATNGYQLHRTSGDGGGGGGGGSCNGSSARERR